MLGFRSETLDCGVATILEISKGQKVVGLILPSKIKLKPCILASLKW